MPVGAPQTALSKLSPAGSANQPPERPVPLFDCLFFHLFLHFWTHRFSSLASPIIQNSGMKKIKPAFEVRFICVQIYNCIPDNMGQNTPPQWASGGSSQSTYPSPGLSGGLNDITSIQGTVVSMIINLKHIFSSIILHFSSLVSRTMWRLQLICFQILFSIDKHLKIQIQLYFNFSGWGIFQITGIYERKINCWCKKP